MIVRAFVSSMSSRGNVHHVESRQLLQRLCFAFMHGLTFAVGTSLTSGAPNTVTWASIHHKTNIGRTSFALPDPNYVANVNEELDSQNVPPAESCGPYL
jgi:Deltex C-terminal domain